MIMHFFRVDAVPDVVSKGVCYVTRDGTDNTSVLHFVSKDGGEIHTVGHLALDNTASGALYTVGDILERDTLTLTHNSIVLVTDASADPNIQSGSAMYYYDVATGIYTLSSANATEHSHLSTLADIDKAATLAANNQSPLGSDPSW